MSCNFTTLEFSLTYTLEQRFLHFTIEQRFLHFTIYRLLEDTQPNTNIYQHPGLSTVPGCPSLVVL